MVGQPFYGKKPSIKKILDEILNGISESGDGTCWLSSVDDGYDLIYRQCPGACGYVWKIKIKDEVVGDWLVNEINQRRHGNKK